jgi:hypothetical protein
MAGKPVAVELGEAFEEHRAEPTKARALLGEHEETAVGRYIQTVILFPVDVSATRRSQSSRASTMRINRSDSVKLRVTFFTSVNHRRAFESVERKRGSCDA